MSIWRAGVWKRGVWKASVWGCGLASITTIYNVVRVHVTTLMKRTAIRAGKRTVAITEQVTR